MKFHKNASEVCWLKKVEEIFDREPKAIEGSNGQFNLLSETEQRNKLNQPASQPGNKLCKSNLIATFFNYHSSTYCQCTVI